LDFLLLIDERGTVLSSGHFRNEFDSDAAALADLLRSAREPTIVRARTPAGSMLALVRARTFRFGERRFTIAGGTAVDSAFIAGLAGAGSDALTMTLTAGDAAIASGTRAGNGIVQESIPLAFIDATRIPAARDTATLTLAHSL